MDEPLASEAAALTELGLNELGTAVDGIHKVLALQQTRILYQPVIDLASGRVIIELAPHYAPLHASNIKTMVSAHYFDGLTILRVQDNYVTQWGDPDAGDAAKARSLGWAPSRASLIDDIRTGSYARS